MRAMHREPDRIELHDDLTEQKVTIIGYYDNKDWGDTESVEIPYTILVHDTPLQNNPEILDYFKAATKMWATGVNEIAFFLTSGKVGVLRHVYGREIELVYERLRREVTDGDSRT